MKTITLDTIKAMNADTFSVQDNSPRGVKTVTAGEIKPGDRVVIDSHFCEVVAAPEQEQNTIPTTAEAREAYNAALKVCEAAKADKNTASEALRQVTWIERGTEDTMRKAANAAAAATAAERASNLLTIAAENVRAAWIAEYLPKVCEVLNRYEGKKIGDKTKEKISDELYTATGCRVRVVFPEYGSDYISVYGDDFPRGLEIYRQYSPEDNKARDFRDGSGKLKHFDPEQLCGCSFDYIADPAAKLAELEKKLEAVKAARAALAAAIDEYNAASGSAFENLNEREISHRCDIIARR